MLRVLADPVLASSAGRLARAGGWSARHPWWLIAGGSPAAPGAAVLKAHNPGSGGQSGQLVFTVSRGTLAQDKAAVEDLAARLRTLPDVLSASDPLSSATTSKNGQAAYSTVHFSVDPVSLGPSYITQVSNATEGARSGVIGVIAAVVVLLLGQNRNRGLRWRQERRVRRPARISLTRISGCSRAAKWPPWPASP